LTSGTAYTFTVTTTTAIGTSSPSAASNSVTTLAPSKVVLFSGQAAYSTGVTWDNTTGFVGSTQFSPATSIGQTVFSSAFNKSKSDVVLGVGTAGFNGVIAYRWSDITGFGAKYTDPNTGLFGLVNSVAFSPASNAVAVAHDSSPYVSAFRFTSGTGFGTAYSNPATLPTGSAKCVEFSPTGGAVAVAHNSSPYVSVYAWNSTTGFGTKYSNPATLPTGDATSVAFTPNGNSIAIGHLSSPFITAYPWSDGSGFGIKYSNPTTSIGSYPNNIVFSPLSNVIAATKNGSPYVDAYQWSSSSGFGTKYSDPLVVPPNPCFGIDFSADGKVLAVGWITAVNPPGLSVFRYMYPWDNTTGFGTPYSAAGLSPPIGNQSYSIKFTP
jgi:hypothetical protein